MVGLRARVSGFHLTHTQLCDDTMLTTHGNMAWMATARTHARTHRSVMADVSATLSPAGRTNMLMLLEAATWGGAMVGPILGAKIANLYSLRASNQ